MNAETIGEGCIAMLKALETVNAYVYVQMGCSFNNDGPVYELRIKQNIAGDWPLTRSSTSYTLHEMIIKSQSIDEFFMKAADAIKELPQQFEKISYREFK